MPLDLVELPEAALAHLPEVSDPRLQVARRGLLVGVALGGVGLAVVLLVTGLLTASPPDPTGGVRRPVAAVAASVSAHALAAAEDAVVTAADEPRRTEATPERAPSTGGAGEGDVTEDDVDDATTALPEDGDLDRPRRILRLRKKRAP